MAFLTIAAVTYPVLIDGASENEPAFGGLLWEVAWDGTAQVTAAPERRSRQFTLQPMTEIAEQTLRNNINAGIVVVSGDAMGGVAKNCVVRITNSDYIDNGALGFYRVPTVAVIQAAA